MKPRKRHCRKWKAGAALLMLWAVTSSAQADIHKIPLPAPNSSQAFDPASGAVVAVDAEKNEIRLYQREFFKGNREAVLGPVSAPELPGHSAFKTSGDKHYLFVPSFTDASISVFDPEKLTLVKVIEVPVRQNTTVFCSQDPGDPWLYFFGSHGKCGRIHIEKLEFDAWLTPELLRSGRLRIDAKGRTIYSDAGAFGFLDRDRAQEEVVIQEVHGTDEIASQAIPDQEGRWAAMATEYRKTGIFDARLRERHAILDFPVIGFDSERNLVVSEKDGTLHFTSLRTFEPWVTFQTGVIARQRDFDRSYLPLFDTVSEVYPDTEAGHLLVWRRDQKVIVISNDLLNPDNQPLLRVMADVPDSVIVGETLVMPLQFSDDVEEVVPEQLPDGMTLEDKTLRWTPVDEQLGENKVVLRLTGKGTSVTEEFSLWADRRYLEFPFAVSAVAASADGSVVVVRDDHSKIATIDGLAFSVMATIDLEKRDYVKKMATDGNNVFLLGASGSEIEVYSAKDMKRVRSIGEQSHIIDMDVVPGGEFLAVYLHPLKDNRSRKYALGMRFYRLPSLTIPKSRSISERLRTGVWPRDIVPGLEADFRSNGLVESIGEQIRVGELVYDRKFQELRLIQKTPFLHLDRRDDYTPNYQWGRTHDRYSLLRSGTDVSKESSEVAHLSNDSSSAVAFIPDRAALVVYTWSMVYKIKKTFSASLGFYELTKGEPKASYHLARNSPLPK